MIFRWILKLKIIEKLKFKQHDATFKNKDNLKNILKFTTCAKNLQ